MEMETKRIEADLEIRRMERETGMAPEAMGTNQGRMDENESDHEVQVRHRYPRAETLADKVKKYGSALKQVVSPMTNYASDIPHFFESLEAMFRSFDVPDDLRGKLLLQFLSPKAKTLISRLSSE